MSEQIITFPNGDKIWVKEGFTHRDDGPAKDFVDGRKIWYQNGLIHREDGPAYEGFGCKCWYFEGKLHRVDGPAVEFEDGTKHWYIHGLRHRENGPAIVSELCQTWYFNNFLHRENGPSVKRADGSEEWYIHGLHHREDGPAITNADKSMKWYLNGFEFPEHVVVNPEKITSQEIEDQDNIDMKAILIQRYGWHRFLVLIHARLIDSRDNLIENTKEALFATADFDHRLVVTCPTGRVFVLGVPSQITSCAEAQKWLGNEQKEKFNVISRT